MTGSKEVYGSSATLRIVASRFGDQVPRAKKDFCFRGAGGAVGPPTDDGKTSRSHRHRMVKHITDSKV